MERVSFDIERDDIAETLHEQARANGRSVEEELAALVERTYAPAAPKKPDSDENWVDEVIRLANGTDLRIPERRAGEHYAPAYPVGMEPLPGENFVEHITRISRPGINMEVERDQTPHGEPRL